MPPSGPLLTADVPWLLYRSFFALPKSIVGVEREPVNALLGTVNALLGVIESRAAAAPRAVVACLGAEQAKYRVELYPPYHAHRDPMPASSRGSGSVHLRCWRASAGMSPAARRSRQTT